MWHGFPVLESERSPGDYFYYHRDSNQFFVGKDNQSSHGLGATTRSIPDGDGWVNSCTDLVTLNISHCNIAPKEKKRICHVDVKKNDCRRRASKGQKYIDRAP